MLEFYRLQQLAHQKGLFRDKYRYQALTEPPTPKVEGSRDLSLPGPGPKYVSRRTFQQRLPVAKYGPFREMHWENDLTGRPEDTVETEPPKEQPLPLNQEDHPAENVDTTPQIPSVTKDTEYLNDPPVHTEERTYEDADAEIM